MNRSVSVQASCEDSGRSYSNTVLNDQAYLDPTTATDRLLKAGQWKQSLHKNRKNHKTSVSGLNRSNFRFSIGEAIPKLKAIEERWRPISQERLGRGRPPIGKPEGTGAFAMDFRAISFMALALPLAKWVQLTPS